MSACAKAGPGTGSILIRFSVGALRAVAEFVHALVAVQSSTDLAFRHDIGGVSFVFLIAGRTYKSWITHGFPPSSRLAGALGHML
jgi:hypothetical protein